MHFHIKGGALAYLKKLKNSFNALKILAEKSSQTQIFRLDTEKSALSYFVNFYLIPNEEPLASLAYEKRVLAKFKKISLSKRLKQYMYNAQNSHEKFVWSFVYFFVRIHLYYGLFILFCSAQDVLGLKKEKCIIPNPDTKNILYLKFFRSDHYIDG